MQSRDDGARTKHELDRVLSSRMCAGCGACAYVGDGVQMVDVPSVGRRPEGVRGLPIAVKDQILAVCPGASVRAPVREKPPASKAELLVGDTRHVWEGWATDPEIRRRASSGGAVTALAAYCIEQLGMRLVVHTGMDLVLPWLSSTIVSDDREDLALNSGSRYAPSSPVEALREIEHSDRPCVFIGKPCDVAAVAELRKHRPSLDRNLGLVLSFFCAGTPATAGTLALAGQLGFDDPSAIASIRYRGNGWPGRFRVQDRQGREASLSYEESWGALARRHRQLRCQVCPDGLGELADVTGGDAWHRRGEGTDGISLILARTELGRRIVLEAADAGYVAITDSNADRVVLAQGLVRRRKLVLARLAALKMLGLRTPRFPGFRLGRAALEISPVGLAREFTGMLRRAITRGYRKPESTELGGQG